jgi:hypothetical protein
MARIRLRLNSSDSHTNSFTGSEDFDEDDFHVPIHADECKRWADFRVPHALDTSLIKSSLGSENEGMKIVVDLRWENPELDIFKTHFG